MRPTALRRLSALLQRVMPSLNWTLDHARWVLLTLLAVIGLNIWLYISIPKTFFPSRIPGG